MYGIKDFTAVINPPHATILAVGAGEERAIVKNGKIEAAMMMSVTLSCDHRAVDGALGAELLGRVQDADRKSGDDGGVRFGQSSTTRTNARRCCASRSARKLVIRPETDVQSREFAPA